MNVTGIAFALAWGNQRVVGFILFLKADSALGLGVGQFLLLYL
tara:strand:+ start:357 stop:485 length:129 start_codon:yes stop_codon:yes gene_type:complete